MVDSSKDVISSKTYCLTQTINKSSLGNKYYHNIKQGQNKVLMRPRVPMRFDFNDVDFVKMDPESPETRILLRHYDDLGTRIDGNNLFRLKRTRNNIANTFLLYLLAVALVVASIVNMKKISHALQNDATLSQKDKRMFRMGFALSFGVVLFLASVVTLSMFELHRNWRSFSPFTKDSFRYKDIDFTDGRVGYVRPIVLSIVVVVVILAMAETLNLFFMNTSKPAILFLLSPILLCVILMVNIYSQSSS